MELKAVWGPKMWAELHGSYVPSFLLPWMERLPCGECFQMADAIVQRMPPTPEAWKSAWEWHRWTWQFHNEVRRHLGQPLFSLEEAIAKWGWTRPPQAEGSD